MRWWGVAILAVIAWCVFAFTFGPLMAAFMRGPAAQHASQPDPDDPDTWEIRL